MQYRMVHGADKTIQSFGFFLQRFAMRLQGIKQVEIEPVKGVLDGPYHLPPAALQSLTPR